RGAKAKETEVAAISIIRDAGRPIPGRQLLDELVKHGVEIGGKDPMATLNARLSRAESITHVRPHGWKVRDEPRQTDEAADPAPSGESAASIPETTNDADTARGGGI